MEDKQLTITLSKTSAHIAEVFRSSQEIVKYKSVDFKSSKPIDVKEELKVFFDKNEFNDSYYETTLAWSSRNSFFVPSKLLDKSSVSDLYSVVISEKFDRNDLDYSKLIELDMACIYEMPMWIKSFFVRLFPTIRIQHENAMLIRSVFQEYTDKFIIIIACFEDYFSVNIVENSKLIFSNNYDFLTIEDIVYHLKHIIDKQDLSAKKANVVGFELSKDSKSTLNQVFSILYNKMGLKNYKYNSPSRFIKPHILCV